jgi:hypothetical protein
VPDNKPIDEATAKHLKNVDDQYVERTGAKGKDPIQVELPEESPQNRPKTQEQAEKEAEARDKAYAEAEKKARKQ